ncbi:DUF488 family protein [Streptomyces sp. NBC_00257]|uniref:DUF488 domain-containing protein n=1 Tax=unclassified Streptomyces TaxID=2593676 RepID=UPI002257D015|nr:MULTISPECIES: DUF488 family protein [unclassified Streptomyces]WTB56213.1 DUF488 family protein [Streptomyces sp. NBC_00826]WTH90905.1 DUF488 family protein [Streptomyces sp. NBC_00825]WTH99631.1 DUF488 family protein [Streptomyces sp. NBC_00822]MCX4865083.1 DUF488 family protein [Streptomyces sp. NBC_00906]MCX4896321.1 DUF488 family protein [Streptomyces sp. NBC_00892]
MGSSSDVRVRRVYEPKEDADGTRVLVDRLWPRGESKEKAAIDKWLKDITPSNELRDWYHEDRTATRYDEFVDRYRAELADPVHAAAVHELVELVREGGPVTLITAVKDVPHSHVPVIVDHLEHELRHH